MTSSICINGSFVAGSTFPFGFTTMMLIISFLYMLIFNICILFSNCSHINDDGDVDLGNHGGEHVDLIDNVNEAVKKISDYYGLYEPSFAHDTISSSIYNTKRPFKRF